MKIAFITDTHFGARNSSRVFARYFDKFYYEFFFPYLEEHGINRIIHLGDLVDNRKQINFLAARDLRKFVRTCTDKDIEFGVIVGNHDAYHKNSNEVNSLKEIFSDSNLKWTAYENPETINIDGLDIAVLPWINSGNYAESFKFIEETPAEILLGHLDIAGFEMYKGSVQNHGIDRSAFRKFDTVMTGHFHHKSTDGQIFYLGAPYQITWSDWNDDRGFHIFDTDTRRLTYIKNPFEIFHKIIYDDTPEEELDGMDYSSCYIKVIVKNKTSQLDFDKFLSRIEQQNPEDLQVFEDAVGIEFDGTEIEAGQDTLSIIKTEIQNSETKVDKDRLTGFISDLYFEAERIE